MLSNLTSIRILGEMAHIWVYEKKEVEIFSKRWISVNITVVTFYNATNSTTAKYDSLCTQTRNSLR